MGQRTETLLSAEGRDALSSGRGGKWEGRAVGDTGAPRRGGGCGRAAATRTSRPYVHREPVVDAVWDAGRRGGQHRRWPRGMAALAAQRFQCWRPTNTNEEGGLGVG